MIINDNLIQLNDFLKQGELSRRSVLFKGLFTIFFYRSNLIFWIVMGCGIADFGRICLKMPHSQNNWYRILSPLVSTRSATWSFD